MADNQSVDNDSVRTYHTSKQSMNRCLLPTSWRFDMTWLLAFAIAFGLQMLDFKGLRVDAQNGAFQLGTFPGRGEYQTWLRASVLYNEGNALRRSGNYANAILKYKAAISIYPYSSSYFHNLGIALHKSHDFKGAEAAFRRALALEQTGWDSWIGMGNALQGQNRFSEAKAAFQKSLQSGAPVELKPAIEQAITDVTNSAKKATAARPVR